MRLDKRAACLAGVMTMVLTASAAQGQVVTFSDINDAVPSKYFDAATSAPDVANANRLIIGFNSGIDPATFSNNDFRASTAAFSRPSAMDTISFRIDAPAGFYISRIIYTQRGGGSTARTGQARGGSNWVLNGSAYSLGMFGTNPTLSSTADFTGMNLTSIPVSITTGLFAFSTPLVGSATVAVTGADVQVELLPLIE